MPIGQIPKNKKTKIPKNTALYYNLKAAYESKSSKVGLLAEQFNITREYLSRFATAEKWERGESKAKIKTAIKTHLTSEGIVDAKEDLATENTAYVDDLLERRQEQEAEMIEQPQSTAEYVEATVAGTTEPQPTAAESSIILDAPKPEEDILSQELFAAARKATIEKLNSDGELIFAKLTNLLMETTYKMLESGQISEVIGLGGGVEKIEMREFAINDVKDLKFASDIVTNVARVIGKVSNTQQNNFQFNSTNVSTEKSTTKQVEQLDKIKHRPDFARFVDNLHQEVKQQKPQISVHDKEA